ncbi:MAG: TlpA family protein disulfide reductase [Fibrobacter sp.]|nr:TlpA family protein disulfide reductase [Fibrobacter sp.]
MRKILCLLILLCTVFVQAKSSSGRTEELVKPAPITDSLPWFAIREINDSNSPFTRTFLEKLAGTGERTALVFFATWCQPCREGIKILAKNENELAEHHVNVVLVNIGVKEVEEKKIRSWVKNLGADSFKLVIDPFKVMTEGFGLVEKSGEIALPKTLVIDRKAKPLFLLGQEGSDWPRVLWEK